MLRLLYFSFERFKFRLKCKTFFLLFKNISHKKYPISHKNQTFLSIRSVGSNGKKCFDFLCVMFLKNRKNVLLGGLNLDFSKENTKQSLVSINEPKL